MFRHVSAAFRQASAQASITWPSYLLHSSAQVSHASAQTEASSPWNVDSRAMNRACPDVRSAVSRHNWMHRSRSASLIWMHSVAHASHACAASKQLSTHSATSGGRSNAFSAMEQHRLRMVKCFRDEPRESTSEKGPVVEPEQQVGNKRRPPSSLPVPRVSLRRSNKGTPRVEPRHRAGLKALDIPRTRRMEEHLLRHGRP